MEAETALATLLYGYFYCESDGIRSKMKQVLLQGDNKGFQVCKRKMISSAEQLCANHPPAFRKFTEFVLNLKFDEQPKYAACIALFQPLIDGPCERPIHIDPNTLKVRPSPFPCCPSLGVKFPGYQTNFTSSQPPR